MDDKARAYGTEDRNLYRVWAELAAGMAIFGSATPVSKIVTGAMPVFIGSALRVTLGAFVLAPAAMKNRHSLCRIGRHDWLRVALIALFGMFGFSVLMLYGMRLIPGVVGAVVMSTAPAVTAVASIIFLGERATWRKSIAIAAAVAGVMVLHTGQESGGAKGSGGDLLLGALFVFGAVCCETAYTLLGKAVSARVDPIVVAFLGAALSIPLFVPFAIWQWPDFDPAAVGWRGWAAVAWYGAGTLALGSWLWYTGLAKAEGVVAAVFMGVMPASALILSYVLLGEPFRWLHIVGFGIVFAGVLLISWEHARMARGA